MSTMDYLKTLNRDQLAFARDEAQRLIAEIDEQEKVTLWLVSCGGINEAAFREADFKLAKERLAEVIVGDDFHVSDVRSYHPKIEKIILPESEAAEYLGL